jgi:hypothetical protein
LKGCKFPAEQGNLSVFFFIFVFEGVERKLLEKIMMEENVGIVVRFLARCSGRFELLFCSHLFNAAHICQQK